MTNKKLKFILFFLFFFIFFFAFASVQKAEAAVYYWVGGTTNSNTNNPVNWNTTAGACANSANATLPGAGDEVYFASNCNNPATINADLSVTSFYIDTGHSAAVTLGSALAVSGTLQVSAGTLAIGAYNVTGGAVTLVAGTISGTTGTMTVTSYTAQSGTISAILAGTGIVFTKTTAGTVTLSGANTFTGGLVIKAGMVNGATSASAFGGSGTGTIMLGDTSGSADATLTGGSIVFPNPITVVSGSNGTLSIKLTGSNPWFSGPITLGNNLTVANTSAAGTLVLSGGITGTGNIVTNVTGNCVINLQTNPINTTGSITNSGSGTGVVTISSVIGTNVTGVIQNSATSQLTLSGNNTFSSGLIIKKGTVIGQTSANAFGAGTITLGNSVGGSDDANLYSTATNYLTHTNPIILASNTTGILRVGGAYGTTFTGGITGNNNLVINNANQTTFSTGAINNAGTITNTGSVTIISSVIGSSVTGVVNNSTSILSLAGNNAFSGGVTILKGTVGRGGSTNAFGSGTVKLGDNAGGNNNATLDGGSSGSVANPIILASNTTGTLTISGNNMSFTGGVTGNNNFVTTAFYALGFSGGAINNSGTITNSGGDTLGVTISSALGPNVTSLIQNSATSPLTLSGNNSTVGIVSILAGTLALSGTTNLNVSGNWSNAGTFTANQSTVTFTSGTHTISGANTFYNTTVTPNSTMTFPASVTQTISNTFSCTGTAGNMITINSSSAGTQATLSKASGTVSCDYISLTDSAAAGGATWNAGNNSLTYTNVTGWTGGFDMTNVPPTVALNTADAYSFGEDTTPILEFTGTDAEGNDISYNIHVDNNADFSSVIFGKVSGTHAGFANTVNGADTNPFTSGQKASFTVQEVDALPSGTYYYRVRASDPAGSNTYGAWSATRSFTVFVPPPPSKVKVNSGKIKIKSGKMIIQ